MIIHVKEARYVDGYRLRITFNTGESAVVDFRQLIAETARAAPLQDIHQFKSFYLDEWPTLACPNRHGASTAPNDAMIFAGILPLGNNSQSACTCRFPLPIPPPRAGEGENESLRDFHDSGFDIAPESLYQMATGKLPAWMAETGATEDRRMGVT